MLGKASEIKTKLIESGNFGIDENINNFLELNPRLEVIDIQYRIIDQQVYIGDGLYRPELTQTALIIYKEV